MKPNELIEKIGGGNLDSQLELLYGNSHAAVDARSRYISAVREFMRIYPERDDVHIFSASGRTEIGGNHTDHQHGCVLAAAVNLDVIAVGSFHHDGIIRLKSSGHKQNHVDLSDMGVKQREKGTSNAMIRGIAAKFTEMGVRTDGFDAYTISDVLGGSGLSSSAAFEVLVGTVIDKHYNEGRAGYSLCITDTKGSHSDLTDDYVSVPTEMKRVAHQFGKEFLRDVSEEDFYSALPKLREKCSDRAILRAAHFFGENKRVALEAEALSAGNIDKFLEIVRCSGDSSANLLQNLYSVQKPTNQEISLAIMMSKRILGNRGSVRVHGGGFAGTIQGGNYTFAMAKSPVETAFPMEDFPNISAGIVK